MEPGCQPRGKTQHENNNKREQATTTVPTLGRWAQQNQHKRGGADQSPRGAHCWLDVVCAVRCLSRWVLTERWLSWQSREQRAESWGRPGKHARRGSAQTGPVIGPTDAAALSVCKQLLWLLWALRGDEAGRGKEGGEEVFQHDSRVIRAKSWVLTGCSYMGASDPQLKVPVWKKYKANVVLSHHLTFHLIAWTINS